MNNLYGYLANDFLDDSKTYKFDLINNSRSVVNSEPVEISGSNQYFSVSSQSGSNTIDELIWEGDEITVINDSDEDEPCSNIACYVEDNGQDYFIGYFQFDEGKVVKQDEGVEVPSGATVKAEIKPIFEPVGISGTIFGTVSLSPDSNQETSTTISLIDTEIDQSVDSINIEGLTDREDFEFENVEGGREYRLTTTPAVTEDRTYEAYEGDPFELDEGENKDYGTIIKQGDDTA